MPDFPNAMPVKMSKIGMKNTFHDLAAVRNLTKFAFAEMKSGEYAKASDYLRRAKKLLDRVEAYSDDLSQI